MHGAGQCTWIVHIRGTQFPSVGLLSYVYVHLLTLGNRLGPGSGSCDKTVAGQEDS